MMSQFYFLYKNKELMVCDYLQKRTVEAEGAIAGEQKETTSTSVVALHGVNKGLHYTSVGVNNKGLSELDWLD